MTVAQLHQIEEQRLSSQAALDSLKSQLERNKLGQFATPPVLAADIIQYAKSLVGDYSVRFLEPSIGTGSFYSSLRASFPENQVETSVGFEIDDAFYESARSLWSETPLKLVHGDFTLAQPPRNEADRFNLVISNPPYVRHHHLSDFQKKHLQSKTAKIFKSRPSGLTGLYCYFLGLADLWMQDGGLAGWLIPSEFMDVNYGEVIKRYLSQQVTLLHIHRFDPDDVQFDDALVSSAVVWFKKSLPSKDHQVKFSYGGSMMKPSVTTVVPNSQLQPSAKWTQIALSGIAPKSSEPVIGDFFEIRRGLATGDNKFFIMTGDEARARSIPAKFLRPVLPSPRHLRLDKIESDGEGLPLLATPLYLLDCRLPEETIMENYPSMWSYLSLGVARGVKERYLCQNRVPWYAQELRDAPTIACTYIGRPKQGGKSPFRFILNNSRATITNSYLGLYPKTKLKNAFRSNPSLTSLVWKKLSSICPDKLIKEGRVYGGGMYKLEPKELKNVPVPELADYFETAQTLFD